MITAHYPCVRAGKSAVALAELGWDHDMLCGVFPLQHVRAYTRMILEPGLEASTLRRVVRAHGGSVLHVHTEPNWPAIIAKEVADGRPVVLNVHDVTAARSEVMNDPREHASYEAADAFVFVTEEQRRFAIECGFPVEGKPHAVLPNFALARYYIDQTPLPHLGGVVFEGGISGSARSGDPRNMHPVYQALNAAGLEFHVYGGRSDLDYGIKHPPVRSLGLLPHRLAQHDWGFVGTPAPTEGFLHALPNKLFDYMGAGIPVIAMNMPLIEEYCRAGAGVYCHTMEDVVDAASGDPAEFRESVKRIRADCGFEARGRVLGDLYDELGV